MISASPSLVAYIERHDLPTRTSCDSFISGVAAYLAAMSWLYWLDEQTIEQRRKLLPIGFEVLAHAEAPNEDAMRYAHFFAGAIVVKDPEFGRTFSLAVVLAAVWRRLWPDAHRDDWIHGTWAAELGWCVAAEADGSGSAWTDYHEEHGLNPPRIEAGCEDFFVRPPDECSDGAAMKRKRIIIVGPGGSGKDHLSKLLVQHGYNRAVSCTTRPPRKNEMDGVDYHFITDKDFRRRIAADEFREWYSFGADNWLYGTLERDFQKSDLFIMSPPVLGTLGQETLDESIVIYLDIPIEIRRERLEARADADSVGRRLVADAHDFYMFSRADVTITDPEFSVDAVLAMVKAVHENAGIAQPP